MIASNAANAQLRVRQTVPADFFGAKAADLYRILGGPTLFQLDGVRTPPLFVTVLLHGNEPTGFDAIQRVLARYRGRRLPRAMWLFVGNVAAAAVGRRLLDGQLDYNRAWPGTEYPACPETALMTDVVARVGSQPLFASVDLHNNTGCNPHYACVNQLDTSFLRLATLFSRSVVYFRQPTGVQSMAMADHCPSVTLECGKAGEDAALDHAIDFLDACLHMHHLPDTPVPYQDIHLLQTQAIVRVRPDVDFGFTGDRADVLFRRDLETFNFGLLPAGAPVAVVREGYGMPLVARQGSTDVTDSLFAMSRDKLVTRQPLIPSMATQDIDVIRQDCLFYVMEEMQGPGAGPAPLP